MADWTEPQDLREWAGRAFSLRPIAAGILLLALLAAELKFDWLERAAGAYLVSTNAERPESGAIWEKGRKTQIARTAIEKLATDREAFQRVARNAGSFNEVVDALAPGQGVMLSVEHFREIYRKLPEGVAAELISPFDLLRLLSEGRWSRTYIERSADGLMVYLLEPNNHVLRQAKVGAASLSALARGSAAAERTLEDLADFRNRIYPAERFFAALASLPEEVRRALVSQPERLLDVSGQISRVGVSDESVSGRVEVGFEIRSGSQRRVELVQAQDWAVWRLRSALEGRPTAAGSASSFPIQ
ncbi:MAG: hypothetical protein MUD16_08155 [Desulfobacterales bacterium]|jgi:hypothetical protein|nr:hypothetical protein [Desulfobacterales bacterium]